MALTSADLEQILPEGIDTENPGKYQELIEDLQGNILKGHGREYSVHLFLQFKSNTDEGKLATKKWIQSFAQQYVTSAKKQSDDSKNYKNQGISGGIFCNLLLTFSGYDYLGISYAKTPKDIFFRSGMKDPNTQAALSDPNVKTWEPDFQEEIHALILMADDDLVDLLQEINRMYYNLRQVAEIVHREDGFTLRNNERKTIEHFGFADGVSQPLFVKSDIEKAKKKGADFNIWDPRSPLKIILAKDPNGKKADSYGSYLVYRKLEQNVKSFHEEQRKLAETLGVDFDLAGAMIVGRFQDGTPIVLSDQPEPNIQRTNNFTYTSDGQGSKCPFHAHTRKVNPRGDTGTQSATPVPLADEKMHRIARRAVSYGENDITKEPETGSGLLFLCFQSDIQNQFNFQQASWANQDNFVQPTIGKDPVIGQGNSPISQKWPTGWGSHEQPVQYKFPLWVNLKGGEYFFAPSISFLTTIGF
jgi:Dyp-type peroxidase family